MSPAPPIRPKGQSPRHDDASKVAFILSHTPPGFRPDFEMLARRMIAELGKSNHPSTLALTLQLAWKRARRKAMATPN